jgi:hypothetical protein
MNAELLKKAEDWLAQALQKDLMVDEFKAVTQLVAVLSKDAGSGEAPSFSPEKCREGLQTFFGKEAQ